MHTPQPRVLFILKRREDYSQDPSYSNQGMSTGLLNSATFMHDMLMSRHVVSKIVVVVDNNCIDREVALFKPTHVIIEALWVVPSKFAVLEKLHPTVKWIVRYHSDAPFIAGEGVAMKWTLQYLQDTNVILGINAPRFLSEVRELAHINGILHADTRVTHLPNHYPVAGVQFPKKHTGNVVNVGCFGAVRPLKNQFIQAIAAIKFAHYRGMDLKFHVNGNRVEGKGDNVLKNIREMFSGLNSPQYELVEHEWMPHKEFKQLISSMDIGLQVSFSETFNIVAADFITAGVPVVGSEEIPWLKTGIASATSSDDIVRSMDIAWTVKWYNVLRNIRALDAYVERSESVWMEFLAA